MTPPAPSPAPFWSVMIPVHNPPLNLLRETIASVRNAGVDPATVQLTVVDDASTDAAVLDWLTRLPEQGIEVLHAPARRGLVGNWNACLAAARGEWVHILHQDDRVRPGFYAALEAGIRTAPSIGAALTQTAFIDEDGTWLRDGHLDQTTAGLLDHWIQHVVVNLAFQCPAIVVRRAVYEQVGGFDDRFRYCADAEMWQRIAVHYPLWYDPRPLAEYRVHPASATHRLFTLPERWRERRRCLHQTLPRLSPIIRARTRQAGLHFQTRLAWSEWRQAWTQNPAWHARLRLLPALAQVGTYGTFLDMHRRRYPAPIPGRAPARDADPAGPRLPRLLLLSEFFPHPPERAVFGVFQRLYRHFQGLGRVGPFDATFLWSDNYQVPPGVVETCRQQLAATWPFNGRLCLISTTTGAASEFHHHPLRALYWMLMGAASFMQARPNLRCCGPRQVAQLRAMLEEAQPDLILAFRTGVMGPLLRMRQPLPPVVLDLDDIEHVKVLRFHQGVDGRTRLRNQTWAWIARRSERHATALAATTLVCSEADGRELLSVAPRARVKVLPNTARVRTARPPASEPIALFVGVAYYPPNLEAIQWLVNDIWPRVRARHPEARLIIVGEGAETLVGDPVPPGLEVRGFEPDLDAVYARARFTVCPIRRGSGTRIKIIESAFCARPTVSTTLGAEGLSFRPGHDILIADDAATFAEACGTLLHDPARCVALGQAACAHARLHYDPEHLVGEIARHLRAALPASLLRTP
jgi:glycosyltransferase involved in cell wall biosynthesis